ncbi:hypothetical protein CNBG_9333 [Cryptococcus deuterogattii R265]|uniref:uncharacterized protein n=1 Tax=Cryptococcus deuterogattii (strain R265) TaxID=294750 RepID=UPI001938FB7D|nr:hypothetical protein CNBG_9333 [Cryptococcus deuterogattii R265]
MPPKLTAFQPPSPSPPPPTNDPHDLLVIQDIMDTLDQIPPELTRVHSDLNELGAVLYSTLVSLEKKLYTLIDWIQDPNVTPEKRFELLQEIAEEAARYKLGGDDKIRVAAGACDGILNHQKHISNLLASSTLLNPSPPSPYSQALTLPFPQPVTNSRRVARAANSPFGGRGYAGNGGPSETKVGDTPSKKKRSRVQQLGAREDDETSSAGGEKKKPVKRRKQNRAASPTDSIVSNSGFGGKPIEPVPPVNSPPLPIGPAVKRMTEVPILNPEQVTTTSATYPCNPPFQSTQSAPMVWAWIWAAEKAVV